MTFRGSPNRYGSFAATLHWVSAIAVFALLALGFLAANAADDAHAAALLRLHVPLGVLVLALTLVRLAWKFFDVRPNDVGGQSRWQAATARITHALAYGLLVVMGASGIGLLILSAAAPVLFFGAPGALPRFSQFPPMAVHGFGAFAMVGLLCIHVGAALYHQFYRRDRLFARMGLGSLQFDRDDGLASANALAKRSPGTS